MPAPTVTSWRPAPVARVRSWLGDWLVVAAWLAVLTVVGVVAAPLLDGAGGPGAPGTDTLLVADLMIAAVTVVPYVVYLSTTEASAWRATLGKRWAGLLVADARGGRAPAGSVWLRNVVKALPWQLAHLGVSRAVLEVQQTLGVVLLVASLALAAACVAPALVGGRGVHDRAAGTRVQRQAWAWGDGAAG